MAYLDEIQIDAGKSPSRKEPELEEEKQYDRMLLNQLRKEAGCGNSP